MLNGQNVVEPNRRNVLNAVLVSCFIFSEFSSTLILESRSTSSLHVITHIVILRDENIHCRTRKGHGGDVLVPTCKSVIWKAAMRAFGG